MASHPLTLLVWSGNACRVEFAVLANGNCPAKDFLEGECEQIREGEKGELDTTARARFMHLFQHMSAHGEQSMSRKRFKKEMGKFSAFSHEVKNIQIRFPCFRDGANWIVTHGFVKPGAKKKLGQWPPSQVKRAAQIMSEYFVRKSALSQGKKR